MPQVRGGQTPPRLLLSPPALQRNAQTPTQCSCSVPPPPGGAIRNGQNKGNASLRHSDTTECSRLPSNCRRLPSNRQKIVLQHIVSDNDQRDATIIWRYVCWGRKVPSAEGRGGGASECHRSQKPPPAVGALVRSSPRSPAGGGHRPHGGTALPPPAVQCECVFAPRQKPPGPKGGGGGDRGPFRGVKVKVKCSGDLQTPAYQ